MRDEEGRWGGKEDEGGFAVIVAKQERKRRTELCKQGAEAADIRVGLGRNGAGIIGRTYTKCPQGGADQVKPFAPFYADRAPETAEK